VTGRILLIEDDRRLAEMVKNYLAEFGFSVTTAHSGGAGIALYRREGFDALILDLMLPDIDGLEVCRQVRADGKARILMLTARGDAMDRIIGLEMGADDYLAKPFEPRELALRVANILKRSRPARTAPLQSVRFGPFVFHMGSGELRRGDEAIRLTERECEMLRVLATNAGETVPREALAGNGEAVSERTVDVQVNRLRRKIETDPANPLIVQTVRGIGYRLVPVM
jgi:two-component system, OmpR family, phosphate regulon response regulator OmpR